MNNIQLSARIDKVRQKAKKIMKKYEDLAPLGHYFLWADVQIENKLYKVCIGSGCSERIGTISSKVSAIPEIKSIWHNLD